MARHTRKVRDALQLRREGALARLLKQHTEESLKTIFSARIELAALQKALWKTSR